MSSVTMYEIKKYRDQQDSPSINSKENREIESQKEKNDSGKVAESRRRKRIS